MLRIAFCLYSGFAVGAAVSAQERLGMEGAAERVPDVQDIRRGEVFVKDQIRLLKILNTIEKQSKLMRIPTSINYNQL